MLLKWFDAREAAEFGATMADFFAERVPPQPISAGDKKPLRKSAEVIAKLQVQAKRFGTENRLNVFKKAKLANTFQWKLIGLGYDKDVVREISKELVRHL